MGVLAMGPGLGGGGGLDGQYCGGFLVSPQHEIGL